MEQLSLNPLYLCKRFISREVDLLIAIAYIERLSLDETIIRSVRIYLDDLEKEIPPIPFEARLLH